MLLILLIYDVVLDDALDDHSDRVLGAAADARVARQQRKVLDRKPQERKPLTSREMGHQRVKESINRKNIQLRIQSQPAQVLGGHSAHQASLVVHHRHGRHQLVADDLMV